MGHESPKGQHQGFESVGIKGAATPLLVGQRVEENAFHL
jgi:hypothetical protein